MRRVSQTSRADNVGYGGAWGRSRSAPLACPAAQPAMQAEGEAVFWARVVFQCR